MTDGKSDFKVVIDRKAIVDIVDKSKQLRIEDIEFIKRATYDDVHAAYILLSLESYLKERRCEPDFVVVLSE